MASRDANDEPRPLPYWACAVGVLGIVVIDRLNKTQYHGRGKAELPRKRLMLVCFLYGCIILWALYALPLVVKEFDLW